MTMSEQTNGVYLERKEEREEEDAVAVVAAANTDIIEHPLIGKEEQEQVDFLSFCRRKGVNAAPLFGMGMEEHIMEKRREMVAAYMYGFLLLPEYDHDSGQLYKSNVFRNLKDKNSLKEKKFDVKSLLRDSRRADFY